MPRVWKYCLKPDSFLLAPKVQLLFSKKLNVIVKNQATTKLKRYHNPKISVKKYSRKKLIARPLSPTIKYFVKKCLFAPTQLKSFDDKRRIN